MTYDDFLEIELLDRATLVGFADDVAMVVTADSAGQLEIKANDCRLTEPTSGCKKTACNWLFKKRKQS